jgi:hypothetical protein
MGDHSQTKTDELTKQARKLLSIACLVKDAAKHDELQQNAQELSRQSRAELNAITGTAQGC